MKILNLSGLLNRLKISMDIIQKCLLESKNLCEGEFVSPGIVGAQ